MVLTEEQQDAMNSVIKGKNVCISGPGGSGKTHLIKEISKWCLENDKICALTALTGVAAVLINGTTIHSWGGIDLATLPSKKLIEVLLTDRYKFCKLQNWRKVDILVIDEISMMSAELFRKIIRIATSNKIRNRAPIQFVLSGDFAQLAPINKKEKVRFCFESSKWDKTVQEIFHFKTIIRQRDPVFCAMLNRIRFGDVTEKDKKVLNNRLVKNIDCVMPSDPLAIKPTILYPYRNNVDILNNTELHKLDTELRVFNATHIFTRSNDKDEFPEHITVSVATRDRYIKLLDKNGLGMDKLTLAIGAQVMLTINLDIDSNLVNGSRGVVVGFDTKLGNPIVKFEGIENTTIDKFSRKYETKRFNVTRSQYPLTLCWSFTCHKSQGATLTSVVTDLSKVFAPGQAYVTLSRVQSISGLHLLGINYERIKCHSRVKQFYSNLDRKKKEVI